MTTYFAFKPADKVQQEIDALLGKVDGGSKEPLHELHTRVSVAMIDEILKNCVEELVHRFQASAEGAGVLNTLLSILKSTAHVLVKQLLGKHSNEDVAKMAVFLRQRRVVLANGEVRHGFALPDAMAAQFKTVFAAIAAGEGKDKRVELNALMLSFADLALVHFYDDFVTPMDLGFIKRKAADLGRSTISKGIHVAINKLIPQLGNKELAIYADYYGSLLLEA
jgi:hypothetical protein